MRFLAATLHCSTVDVTIRSCECEMNTQNAPVHLSNPILESIERAGQKYHLQQDLGLYLELVQTKLCPISELHRSMKAERAQKRTNLECRTKNGEASFGVGSSVHARPIHKNPTLYFRPTGSIVS
jgi:hypothetical protein